MAITQRLTLDEFLALPDEEPALELEPRDPSWRYSVRLQASAAACCLQPHRQAPQNSLVLCAPQRLLHTAEAPRLGAVPARERFRPAVQPG